METFDLEKESSMDALFKTSWPVYPDYRIEDDNLIAVGEPETIDPYAPIVHTELPHVFADVNPSDNDSIIDFAKRYGLLGYEELVPESESYSDGGINGRLKWRQPEEPLWFVRSHIYTVRLLLELIECNDNRDEERATEIMTSSEVKRARLVERGKIQMINAPVDKFMAGIKPRSRSTVTPEYSNLDGVRSLLIDIVNQNISGMSRTLAPWPDKRGNKSVQSFFDYRALIQVIYWQLANSTERGMMKECEYCGALFVCTDGRQRFCPKRRGERESHCSNLHRQKKWRKKRNQ